MARLYLLVEIEFEPKSALAAELLSVIILSPANCFSFTQGHFHRRLAVLFGLRGFSWLGNEAEPLKVVFCNSPSAKFQPWPGPFPRVVCDVPAGGAAEVARGKPLSCERIGWEEPNAESGTLSSSSSKKGSRSWGVLSW